MTENQCFRVGSKVPINVYEGDRPVCQCHNTADATAIVNALNTTILTDILAAIEVFCADEFCEELEIESLLHPERLSPKLMECATRLREIYKLAHGHNTLHSCYSVHESWRIHHQ